MPIFLYILFHVLIKVVGAIQCKCVIKFFVLLGYQKIIEMGRKKALEVRKYFKKVEDKQICQVQNCQKMLTGDNVTNMCRHLEKKHREVFIKFQTVVDETRNINRTKNKGINISINTSEELIWEGCIELATTGGLPLSFIHNNGFKKIVKPIKDKIEFQKELNVLNLKTKINETAAEIRSKIKEDIKNSMISVKIDCVSRLCRSLLGINIQYEENGKIQIRTLAVKDLRERHTGFYIKTVINDVLKEYGVTLKQIYTITSDNGTNMIKTVALLREDLEAEINEESEDEELEMDMNEIENLIVADSNNLINCMRCAAHTLQLVVCDAIKDVNLGSKIAECRKLAIALRKPSNYTKIVTQKLRKPILNTPTRWNSSFDMIERLQELKDFCLRSTDKDLFVNEELWNFMEEFLKVFRPLKKATIHLQNTQMTLGDFYKHWLCLKIELNKLNSIMVPHFLQIINNREKILMENQVLLSALYLDPRFKFLLSEEKTIVAQNHLRHLYDCIETVKSKTMQLDASPVSSSSSSFTSSQIDEVNDDLSIYLNSMQSCQNTSSFEQNREKAFREILSFAPERIRDHTINVLSFWKVNSSQYPTLSTLARIVHAVPATQVTVERSFSALKLILAEERNRLSSDVLENILMVKLNYNFD